VLVDPEYPPRRPLFRDFSQEGVHLVQEVILGGCVGGPLVASEFKSFAYRTAASGACVSSGSGSVR
jgi:hypothetical protein